MYRRKFIAGAAGASCALVVLNKRALAQSDPTPSPDELMQTVANAQAVVDSATSYSLNVGSNTDRVNTLDFQVYRYHNYIRGHESYSGAEFFTDGVNTWGTVGGYGWTLQPSADSPVPAGGLIDLSTVTNWQQEAPRRDALPGVMDIQISGAAGLPNLPASKIIWTIRPDGVGAPFLYMLILGVNARGQSIHVQWAYLDINTETPKRNAMPPSVIADQVAPLS